MNLTKERAIELHRELWDWLYHHPSKGKRHWPKWEFNGGTIPQARDSCFACEYAKEFSQPCDHCPLDWGTSVCEVDDSPFEGWKYASSPKTCKKYAKIIRDLPEKKS